MTPGRRRGALRIRRPAPEEDREPVAMGSSAPEARSNSTPGRKVTVLTPTRPMDAGGTPTAHALQLASEYFTTGSGKNLAGDKYVLLATDGGPNGNALTCDAMTCTTNLDVGKFTTNYCDANIVPDGPKLCLDEA